MIQNAGVDIKNLPFILAVWAARDNTGQRWQISGNSRTGSEAPAPENIAP
jgi:hypothetical protein